MKEETKDRIAFTVALILGFAAIILFIIFIKDMFYLYKSIIKK
jgi:hypothetical protein